jgi:hypothetical protein
MAGPDHDGQYTEQIPNENPVSTGKTGPGKNNLKMIRFKTLLFKIEVKNSPEGDFPKH